MTRSKHALVRAALLFVIAAVAIGCGSKTKEAVTTTTTATATTTTSTNPVKRVAFTLPTSPVSFAEFSPVPLLDADSPAYTGPATPKSLADVEVVPALKSEIKKSGVTAALEKNGFVVVPADFKLFQYAYEGNAYEGWPVFVTTDVAYHEWHLAFDKLLRSLEQQVLLPKLEQLVSGSLKASQEQVQGLDASPGAARDAGIRAEQLFQVAAAELGQPVSLGPLAIKEKALIDAHTDSNAISPILGVPIDYSLFTPRGHYTRTPQLTRFFVGMSVLGQLSFCVPGSYKCPSAEPAQIGVLASHVITSDPELVSLWHQIYEPTAFLVGTADDYTPLEVEAAAKSVVSGDFSTSSTFASDVTAIVGKLLKTRPVKINPERASIRLMGTRFVLDSYMLDQLVYPNVGTSDKPRLTPSALDLAASFGSGYAHQLLEKSGATAYANYSSQLKKVQKAVASRPAKDWGSTVYDAWLYALEPMFVSHGTAYPNFMRNEAWTAKDLQSGFGSYTELKHDTILFAKQLIAEGGDENTYKPAPRNWVEPDPVAYGRLIEAVKLMRNGLTERNLLTKSAGNLLASELDMLTFFKRIATDELAGNAISSDDNNRLRYIGGELEAIWWRTADVSKYASPSDTNDEALIADIGSSPKGVLELGTGRIDRIYVIVPDDQGNFQLAAGGVYSYYEFLNPPGQRLTDKEWQAQLNGGTGPARPDWEKVFFGS